jgi:hypothetical protein
MKKVKKTECKDVNRIEFSMYVLFQKQFGKVCILDFISSYSATEREKRKWKRKITDFMHGLC